MNGRFLRSAGLLLVVALAGACAGGARMPPRTAPGEVVFGVYRGRILAPDGGRGSFRLWLWAEAPDRLHAEILPPVGGPAWILDAGEGRMAVTDVAAGVCWSGTEEAETLESWLGIPLDVPSLVATLLDGRREPSAAVPLREPRGAQGLPARAELRGPAVGILRIERTGFRVAPRGILGTASVAEGLEVRVLSELELQAFSESATGKGAR